MIVNVKPIPERFRKISKKYRPLPAPIFQGDGFPSRKDIKLAKELLDILDNESMEWYGVVLQKRIR